MTDSPADKAARAVEAWLEEKRLVIRPLNPSDAMINNRPGFLTRTGALAVWQAMDDVAAAETDADTKGLAQAVLDALEKKEPTDA